MALASYFSRVHDAVSSLAAITGPELGALLDGTAIHTDLAAAADEHEWLPAVGLLGNLLGRLYPRITVAGPDRAVAEFSAASLRSNPAASVTVAGRPRTATTTIRFAGHDPRADVSVTASAWLVAVDTDDAPSAAPAPLAALAAACVAAAETFRHAFAGALGDRGRSGPQPGQFELVTGDPSRRAATADLTGLELPPFVLAGAGAIGQACALALTTSGATGAVAVVDPETVELSNVQRYVLTAETDVGRSKVAMVAEHMSRAGWSVETASTRWGHDSRSAPGRGVVLVALDTARDRIAVAAGVHGRVYNAWTQPADLGWSRHEEFGAEPCLACLYYPAAERPSDDELIAAAIRQPRLRVLSYLATGAPIGAPLPQVVEVADIPAPPGADAWTREPLLHALTANGIVPQDEQEPWAGRTVGELYTAGICGGGLVSQDRSGLPAEVVVPLAHQSALAGIMLAVQLLAASHPELRKLRHRPVEGRLDLLTGFPQLTSRPRARTAGCICGDPDYRGAWTSQRGSVRDSPVEAQTASNARRPSIP